MKLPRVYYSDGSTHDGPNPGTRDVQAILQLNDENQPIITALADYYILRDGVWVGVDLFGLFDYLLETGQVLFGRTVSNTKFNQAIARALADREALNG